MAETPQTSSNKKLDEIIRRLDKQPDTDDWHEMKSLLTEVDSTVKNIVKKVDKLDTVVITGNGKPPLNQRVHDVEVAMNAISRIMWIVVGVLVTAVTYGAFRLINIP